jgi:response regulator NasT
MKSAIIAFSNPLLSNWITSVLGRGGYTIEYSCKTAAEVARVADFCTSPVVICGFQFADMTAEGLFGILEGRLEMVTVVLPHQQELIEQTDMVVVPYPVSAMELLDIILTAEKKAAKDAVEKRHADTGSGQGFQLQDRPAEEKILILKAKNILMESRGMTESQAHRFLQKASMDRGLKLVDLARMVMDRTLT